MLPRLDLHLGGRECAALHAFRRQLEAGQLQRGQGCLQIGQGQAGVDQCAQQHVAAGA